MVADIRSSAVNAGSPCLLPARAKPTWSIGMESSISSAVCVVDEPTPQEVDGVLGFDLGVTNIAVDSERTIYSRMQRIKKRSLPASSPSAQAAAQLYAGQPATPARARRTRAALCYPHQPREVETTCHDGRTHEAGDSVGRPGRTFARGSGL